MDLQTLSSQMKVVIQKHQIVVTEMRNDPQNPVLQKQLQDLQTEIKSLSEKQKQIMQQLRNNLQKKQSSFNPSSNNLPAVHTSTHSQNSQAQELRMVCSAQMPFTNHRVAAPVQTVTFAAKQMPNFVNSLRQPVPPTVNNLASPTATLTFKAPMGTVVLPNCSTTTALLSSQTVEHQKLHPVLVVPSPSSRNSDGAQTGVLLNLVPPIRVPQYPPPSPRSAGTTTLPKGQNQNNCVPVNVTFASATCVTAPKIASPITEKPSNCSPSPSAINANGKQAAQQPEKPQAIKIDHKKKEFMVALGLISRDTLHDLKNKKSERKRRTTANPQFSNAALEEKWRNAAAAQALAPPIKRPRGRPRLDSKPVTSPANGVCSITESSTTCLSVTPVTTTVSRCSASAPSSSPVAAIVNGMHRQISPTAEEKKVEQLLSGLCIVCTKPGDLVKCDSCAKQQHPGCMQPPLVIRPQGQWKCGDCQTRTDPLAAVHSYDVLKAAKEDEKRKLLKKSLELRLKRSQLEGKLLQLKDLASKQKDRQSELQKSLKKIEISLEQFQFIVSNVQQYS